MDTTRLHLREMSQQLGEELVGATDQAACAGEQLGIGDVLETVVRCDAGLLDYGIGRFGARGNGGMHK